MPSAQVTVGATAANLYDLIRGATPPAGASISRTYPGMPMGNGCQSLRIEPGTGIMFIGDASDVSATNKGAVVDAANADKIYERESANGYNNISLSIWLLGNAASQIVNVTWQYA